MGRSVVFRATARDDLLGLYDDIADRSGIDRATGYIDRVKSACGKLGDFPELGRRREHVGSGVRTLGFERRVLIVYRTDEIAVEILRVLYAGREFPTDDLDF